jgi:adenylate kinase
MKIIITGTPCTGKSTAADYLAEKMKLPIIHVNDFAKKEKLILGKERGSYIIDLKKLRKKLEKKDGVIESHLLCEFSLPNSAVFVLRCNPNVLVKRMARRKYSRQKTKDNLECEALDYCTIRAGENYKKVHDIDTTKRSVKQTAGKIIRILEKKDNEDKVDFSSYFLR